MDNLFVKYVTRFMTLSKEEATAMSERIEIQKFKKGTVLLREGQIAREGYFILRGCIRRYTIADGEEKTTDFYVEEEWVTAPESYHSKKPVDHYLECVEDCIVTVGNKESEMEFYKLFKEYPRLQTLTNTIMQMEINKYQEMLTNFKTNSPEQRYMDLMRFRPELFNRVPLHQLASYIGVKPESLSRIRKRIMKNK